MSKRYINTLLIFGIVAISTGLLLWQRIGVEKHATGTVGDQEFLRGEVVHANEVELLQFGGVDIWMDQNTDVKLVDGREGSVTINVVQGRIVAIGALTIETREFKTVIDGTTSFVHYSWRNQIEVASIEGNLIMRANDIDVDRSGSAVLTSTLPPHVNQTIAFDPEHSSAAAFYDQALSNH